MAEIYEINPPPQLLQQGDVLKDIPFVLIPPLPFRIAKPFVGGKFATIKEVQKLEGEEGVAESTLVDVFRQRIMIISQTCDILDRETVAICPVYSIEEYKAKLIEVMDGDTARAQKWLDENILKTKKKRVNYLFHLPPYNNFPDSVGDFQYINTIKKEFLGIENRLVSLSDLGRNVLSFDLATFFSRPAV